MTGQTLVAEAALPAELQEVLNDLREQKRSGWTKLAECSCLEQVTNLRRFLILMCEGTEGTSST